MHTVKVWTGRLVSSWRTRYPIRQGRFLGSMHSTLTTLDATRDGLSFPSLLSAVEGDAQMDTVYSTQVSVECPLNLDDADACTANLNAQFDEALGDKESEFASIVLNSRVTHANVKVTDDNDVLRATVQLYYHYCELEPVGEIIDGDLVLQGMSIRENFGPAFCTLEFAPALGEAFTEIGVVAPWSFMLTASEGDPAAGDAPHKAASFMIPISVEPEHRTGIIRIKIYVDEVGKIPYDEEPLGEDGECTYDMRSASKRAATICAVSVMKHTAATVVDGAEGAGTSASAAVEGAEGTRSGTRSPTNEDAGSRKDSRRGSERSTASMKDASERIPEGKVMDEDEELSALAPGEKGDAFDPERASSRNTGRSATPSFAADALLLEQQRGVIVDIKIASDYDDVLALQAEGYELHCTAITPDGPVTEQEHLWKFHVMASYGTGNETTGLEDVTWVKCLKSLGTLPTVPLFQILHDYDLSEDEDDYAIYLAYKVGPNPRFKRMMMLSSAIEDERFLTSYINAFTAVFRAAPAPIAKAVGGPSGIFLMVDGNPVRDPKESPAVKSRKPSSRESPKMRSMGDADHSKYSSPGGGSEENSRVGAESDVEDESEDEDYDNEEEQLASMMQTIDELQSERSGLLVLNSELQKKAVALIAREKAMQGQTAAARTAAEVVATSASENPEAAHEHNGEKEKQYQDTLVLIVDERQKLNKQLKEFDQLALDLQTRLDDKEMKANGIQSSFKQFKKEILSKAENSRTGQPITAKQAAHFETSEQKHEEDLERVRLRNISLRTTFRKLERTLRAREQLAEGLHMIDFEQLKIENQTLNEKIEERNEDLAKLKRKKTTTVQVLTHIREKLRFVEQANENLAEKLAHLENTTTDMRNIVTSDKLYRDELRGENKELRAKQGFATSDLLLVDYEGRCAKVEQLKAATTELKDRYGILMRQVNKSLKSSTSTPWVASQSNTLK